MSRPLRLAAMISGSGSNLRVLIEAAQSTRLNLEIVQVISNRAEAPGLAHARAADIPCRVINKANAGAAGQDAAVAAALRESGAELILLTGYMRILGADLVQEFTGRMINQHPSLLPRFKGLDTYRRVLEAGDAEHGASIHFVTPELDGGPVIAQVKIPVASGATADSLQSTLAPLEHRLLLRVMELFTHQRVQHRAGAVFLDDKALQRPLELQDDQLQ